MSNRSFPVNAASGLCPEQEAAAGHAHTRVHTSLHALVQIHTGGVGWGGGPSEKQKGKDPTKKAVGLRLAALGASALVLGFLVAPQTSKALHESLWPQKQ